MSTPSYTAPLHPSVIPATVHQTNPPTSGALKCVRCDGWIVCGHSYGVNGEFPICPDCFDPRKSSKRRL